MKLLGLPPKVTSAEVEITKETKEFAFKVDDRQDQPGGAAPQPLLPGDAGAGRGADRPLRGLDRAPHRRAPPSPARRAAPPPAAPAAEKKPDAPPPRPLTRLEGLRQEAEEPRKAGR